MKRPRGGAVRNFQRFFGQVTPESGRIVSESASQRSDTSSPVSFSIIEVKPPLLTKPVALPIQELAFQNYMKGFVEVSPRIGNEIWIYLNTRRDFEYGPSYPDTALNLAASAVALVCFGNLQKSQEAIDLGQEKYCNALLKLKAAFEEPCVAARDCILCTVLMLLVYEDYFSTPDTGKIIAGSFRHWEGALTLLKIRLQKGIRPERFMYLDRNIRRRMLNMHTSPGKGLPLWLHNGADFHEKGIDLDFDKFLVDTIQLQSRIVGTLDAIKAVPIDDRLNFIREIYDSMHECIAADENLKAWATSLPNDYEYEVNDLHSAPTTDKSLIYKGMVHTYKDIQYVKAWNRWRCCRLSLLGVLLDCLNLLPGEDNSEAWDQLPPSYTPTDLPSILSLEVEIQNLLDDICASVPYHFDIKSPSLSANAQKKATTSVPPLQPSPLIWPLNFASRAVPTISDEQRKWMIHKVRIIGDITGNTLLRVVSEMKLEDGAGVSSKLYGVTEARS